MLALVGVVAFALYLLGVNELFLLFGCGLGGALILNARRLFAGRVGGTIALLGLPALLSGAAATASISYSLTTLFLTFLKIGSVRMAADTCSWRLCAAILWSAWAG